jgi:hypothetical protein
MGILTKAEKTPTLVTEALNSLSLATVAVSTDARKGITYSFDPVGSLPS